MRNHSTTDPEVHAALQAVLEMLTDGKTEAAPPELKDDPLFQQIACYLADVQSFARAIAHGDLSQTLAEKGPLPGSLKSVQASLRHLAWQTKMINEGDMTQRVDYMDEFSAAFNALVQRLQATTAELDKCQAEPGQATEEAPAKSDVRP